MPNMVEQTCIEYCWDEIKHRVQAINPDFADAVNSSNIGNEKFFVIAQYRYGDLMSEKGKFYLPINNGKLVPIEVADPGNKLDLQYNRNTHPAYMMLNTASECYVEIQDRIIPFHLCLPGNMLGISVVMFGPKVNFDLYTGYTIYNISAGARSVCMVPKISQNNKHKRLRKYFPIKNDAPKRYIDHFNIFREIGSTINWKSEFLFFKHDFFKQMHTNEWSKITLHLYNSAYKTLRFWSSMFPWELSFTRIAAKRDMKRTTLATNYMKHIFALSTGLVVGHEPAVDDNLLPLSIIQDAYKHDYKLEHAPLVMQSAYLATKPIYTSLNFPLVDGTPPVSTLTSTVAYLDDVRFSFERHLATLKSNLMDISWSPISTYIDDVSVNFHHSFCSDYNNIKPTSKLTEDDRLLIAKYEFEGNHPFFNGVVKLKPQRHS